MVILSKYEVLILRKEQDHFRLMLHLPQVVLSKYMLDSRNGELLGSCGVKNTGGLQSWTTVSTKVNKIKGIHDLYFVFKGNQGDLFNFNWWKFDK